MIVTNWTDLKAGVLTIYFWQRMSRSPWWYGSRSNVTIQHTLSYGWIYLPSMKRKGSYCADTDWLIEQLHLCHYWQCMIYSYKTAKITQNLRIKLKPKASSRIFEDVCVWVKPIRKLGTEHSFSKTTLLSRMEIPTDYSSLVPYRIYTFTPRNIRYGLWMVPDFAEQLYELIPCGRYVAEKKYRWKPSGRQKYKVAIWFGVMLKLLIFIFSALYCFIIYLFQRWIYLCGLISASPHCLFVQCRKGLFIQKSFFYFKH